ncbi:MAG: sodium-dependent transporter [Bacteroidales bacterium]|nr:sodium-dependent transporter [Bacteroidales bacterium]
MANINFTKRDSFGSKFGIIAATAGSAVGLGNIWRFPYVAGENGGGAFVLIYLGFVFMIGVPVMLSEFTIGRRAKQNAFGSFKTLAPGKPWYLVGLMGIVAAFLILAFYSTIAGWTLEYILQSLTNSFSGKNSAELKQSFETFQSGTFRPILWQIIFMGLTGWIVFSGIKNGIEKYTKILMPLLFALIVVMCIRAVTLPGAMKGLEFLFKPDFSKITWGVVLEALGQAAFSLSIGMGTLITYGSYFNKNTNLATTAVQVSMADTFIAILAGVMIFPAVFAFNLKPDEGFGLVFIVLPNIFEQMAGGYIFSIIFFILLAVAALTSTISVLEVVVAYFVEELKISRKKATVIGSVAISALGILCTLSFGNLGDLKIFNRTIFGVFNDLTANIFLPVGAFLIVIFLGWFLGKKIITDELSNEGTLRIKLLGVFLFIIKFIAPIAIALVFLNSVGIVNFS